MTDARLPSRWRDDPTLDQLSDRAWRTFTGSLMWCNEQGTDGDIPLTSLRLFHPEGFSESAADELVRAGMWVDEIADGGGYRVADWSLTQSLAADVDRQRRVNRERQAAWRAAHKPNPSDVTDDVTRDISGDLTDQVTRESHRQGQDRQGALKTTTLEVADCYECRRRSAFPNWQPCPDHVRAIA